MDVPKFDKEDLAATECRPGREFDFTCCVIGCQNQERLATTDFLVPNEKWEGLGFCPKHAELFKEAQWRHRREKELNSKI